MKINKYLSLVAIIAITACNSEQKKADASKDTTKVAVLDSKSLTFEKDSLQQIYNAYIALKEDLVNTKYQEAKQSATNLFKTLQNYKGCESTAVIANNIASAKDISIQRKDFTTLSSDLIALFKHADLKTGTIYVQHCPMANNGDGGDWLSSENKIQNPYYGSEMMECGAVVEKIVAKK